MLELQKQSPERWVLPMQFGKPELNQTSTLQLIGWKLLFEEISCIKRTQFV